MEPYNFQEVILFENKEFILSSNSRGNILFQEHHIGSTLNRTKIKAIFQALATRGFRIYIIKVNKGNLLPSEDSFWVENLKLKRLVNAGIFNVAYISPQNVFNSLELEREVSPGKKFRIKIFKNLGDAVKWIEKILQDELEYRGK